MEANLENPSEAKWDMLLLIMIQHINTHVMIRHSLAMLELVGDVPAQSRGSFVLAHVEVESLAAAHSEDVQSVLRIRKPGIVWLCLFPLA